jgi:hypothetical protein
MNIACTNTMVAADVRAVLRTYGVSAAHEQGPYLNAPTIWVIVDAILHGDKEMAIRRAISQISGAWLHD